MGKETQVIIDARKIATVYNVVSDRVDETNKGEFTKMYDLIKYEKGRDEAVKALSEAGKAITLDSRRREFNSTLQMAIVYCAMNKAVTYSLVSWDNLKKVVRLYKYIKQQECYDEATLQQVIKDLDVYSKGMGKDRYNNTLEAKVKGLKEIYKVEPKQPEVKYEDVSVQVDKLSTNDKHELLAKLLLELEVEVAA